MKLEILNLISKTDYYHIYKGYKDYFLYYDNNYYIINNNTVQYLLG